MHARATNLVMPLSAAKNIGQKRAALGLSMSQDRPSPLPRAGSLPACLNVTDDSEPSVWFSQGLTPSQCVSVYGVRQPALKLQMAAHVGD